jgi:hypothetical protein
MCVSANGTNVPTLIEVRSRRNGMGGYGGSTGGINLGLHPGDWMPVDKLAKYFDFLFTCLSLC